MVGWTVPGNRGDNLATIVVGKSDQESGGSAPTFSDQGFRFCDSLDSVERIGFPTHNRGKRCPTNAPRGFESNSIVVVVDSPDDHRRRKRGDLMAHKKNSDAALQLGLPSDYVEFLESLKTRVRQAQTKAMLSVNRELIALYWDIGRQIVERQEREGWGKSVVDRLATDLQKAFPGIGGFSPSNVWRMRAFFLAYRLLPQILAQPVRDLARESKVAQAVREIATPISSQPVPKSKRRSLAQAARETAERIPSQAVTELNLPILPQPMAGIPWGQNVLIFERLKDRSERLWYAAKTTEHGWSRAILTMQIESDLYGRQGKAVSNFAGTLPAPQSDLAHARLWRDAPRRDSRRGASCHNAAPPRYLFDFLTLHDDAIERDLEAAELRRHRLEDAEVRAGRRREDELLPLRDRLADASSGRRSFHRPRPVQDS